MKLPKPVPPSWRSGGKAGFNEWKGDYLGVCDTSGLTCLERRSCSGKRNSWEKRGVGKGSWSVVDPVLGRRWGLSELRVSEGTGEV